MGPIYSPALQQMQREYTGARTAELDGTRLPRDCRSARQSAAWYPLERTYWRGQRAKEFTVRAIMEIAGPRPMWIIHCLLNSWFLPSAQRITHSLLEQLTAFTNRPTAARHFKEP